MFIEKHIREVIEAREQQVKKPQNRANIQLGGVAERLNAPVLKTGVGASPPWVRIPPPPPLSCN